MLPFVLRSILLLLLTGATLGALGYRWWTLHEGAITDRQRKILVLSEDGVLATPVQVRISASEGDVRLLETLGELGVSFDKPDAIGRDALHIALDNHQWEALEIARNYVSDEDRADSGGRTALQKLLAKGYLNLAQSFVDHGADIGFTVKSLEGEEPATAYYLKKDDEPRIEFMINNAADLNATDLQKKSLVQIALENGAVDNAKMLLRYGADPSELRLSGRSALLELIQNPTRYKLTAQQQIDVLTDIIKRGADLEVKDEASRDLITVAIHEETPSVLDLLLDYRKCESEHGWEAILSHRLDVLRSLFDHGLSVNIKDSKGETPFEVMIRQRGEGAVEVIKVLLDYGANADLVVNSGQRALFVAIADKNFKVAEALISHTNGADVHDPMIYPVSNEFRELSGKKGLFDWYCRNSRGLTPLMVAVLADEFDIAKALIDKGAVRRQKTQSGEYPIQMAAAMENIKMQQLILGVAYEDHEQERRYIIDISEQKAYLYRGNTLLKSSRCSTGKSGYHTPLGEYVVTDKKKDKVSNIYKGAKMPYFQRFSCTAIGFHQGNTYAGYLSHGCIRLPMENAKFFFNNSKIGDRVTIRK